MSNITKLDFAALNILGKNYLSWILDAEIHLIDERLKAKYLTVKDPLTLWTNLKERYDHQNIVILPNAWYE